MIKRKGATGRQREASDYLVIPAGEEKGYRREREVIPEAPNGHLIPLIPEGTRVTMTYCFMMERNVTLLKLTGIMTYDAYGVMTND